MYKKIQDWILKSKRIRKQILRFFSRQINPRSLGSWCIKEIQKSTLEVDSLVPLTQEDEGDLGLICLPVVKKHKIHFLIQDRNCNTVTRVSRTKRSSVLRA